jgi:hypothetical protein
MIRRLLLPAVLAAVALSAPAALAQGGITPVSPKKGDSVPAGKRPTFKMNVSGPGKVYVHVCKSKKKDADGLICSKESIGKARKKQGSRYEYKARFFDFPAFWLNRPGTYYWQAHRISCENGIDDCRIEGPTIKFKVA